MASLLNMSSSSLLNKGLPYDAEIEYLESSGTQYIELAHGFYKTDEIIIIAATLYLANDKYLIAPKTWNNSNNRFAMVGTLNRKFAVGYGEATTDAFLGQYGDMDLRQWNYKNYVFWTTDGVYNRDVSSTNFGAETTNLRLFWGYNSMSKGRIKSYRQIKDGVLIYDLIPVRKGSVGYMYDKVSGQLFGNAGTGSFILGPDKQ